MTRRLKAALALVLTSTTLLGAEASAQEGRFGRREISCTQKDAGAVVKMMRSANDRIGRDVIMRSGWRARIIQASAMTDTLATLPRGARCVNNRASASPQPIKACAMDIDCGSGGQCLPLAGYSAPLKAGEGMCKQATRATSATPAPAASTAPRHHIAACQQRREELEARGWQVHTVGSRAAKACDKAAQKERIRVGETTSARHARAKITDCKLIACPR